jgi:hypothetical protein
MKNSLSITLHVLLSLALTGFPMATAQEDFRKHKTAARRLLRDPHQHGGEVMHDDKDTRDAPRTSSGATHFTMGNTGNQPPVHTSGNQDYETHIVGGSQSDPGEFPYYGECLHFKRQKKTRTCMNVGMDWSNHFICL